MHLIHKNKLKAFKIIFICCAIFLVGCGGGGGDNKPNITTPSRDIIINDPNSHAEIRVTPPLTALFNNNSNQVTYTVSVRPHGSGRFGITGLNYQIGIAPNPARNGVVITINTCGTGIVYGRSCEFTLQYNGVADLPAAPNYRTGTANITVTVTPPSGVAIDRLVPINVLTNPLLIPLDFSDRTVGIGIARFLPMKTANIEVTPRSIYQKWQYMSHALPIPTIQTYNNAYQPLVYFAEKVRCRNTLIYFVAQRKMQEQLAPVNAAENTIVNGRSINQTNGDNITVKYHPLFGNGLTVGDNILIQGNYRVSQQNSSNFVAGFNGKGISLHPAGGQNVWSGPDNDNSLRQLITTHTSNQYDYIVSELVNIDQPQRFINNSNRGVTKIITVHSLLAPNAGQNIQIRNTGGYADLYAYLGANRNRNVTLQDMSALFEDTVYQSRNAHTNFLASLNAYKNEVARACSG